MSAFAAVKIEKTNYKGWPNSYRISNGEVEAIVTGDVGPRIMRYGFVGGQNFFKEFPEQLGKSGEAAWQARGGHRLWIGPEDRVKSYAPDNDPVRITVKGDVLEATEPVEPLTGLEKQITVRMAPLGTGVEVIHKIRNAGNATFELAPWSLTMFAPGGVGIHGLPPRGMYPDVLDASGPLVLWAYTDLADHRWQFLHKYLVLRQDPKNPVAQKLGTFNRNTWGAYWLNGELFVKRSQAEGAVHSYSDFGCSFETFTNADFLELETLGPLMHLQPGESVTHTELWNAHKNIHLTQWDEDELDRVIAPLVK
jgi:hypothetical protein